MTAMCSGENDSMCEASLKASAHGELSLRVNVRHLRSVLFAYYCLEMKRALKMNADISALAIFRISFVIPWC
jgi:hypothetical protein